MKLIDVKNEKCFSRITNLCKKTFNAAELIKPQNFHKYAYKENIIFKSAYVNDKFVGFFKGYVEKDFIFISWFATTNKKYRVPLLNELKKIANDKNIFFVLHMGEDESFYLDNGFYKPNLSPTLVNAGMRAVVTKPELVNEQAIIDGIKKYDWPLMFTAPFCSYVYYADVSNLDVEKELQNIPEIRREKVNNLKFEKDKKLSLGAWLLLKKALKNHHIFVDNYEYKENENGKPELVACPFEFSISHSGKYVLVGLSKAPIGVDIQETKPIDEKVLKFIANDNDLAFYNSAQNKQDAFYKIWTLKESISKKSGEGMIKPKDIYINYMFLFNGSFLYEFNDIKDYKVAVCSSVYELKPLKEIKL